MEPLHAPWRIQYILGPKPAPSDESIFTRIAQSGDDAADHVRALPANVSAHITARQAQVGRWTGGTGRN